MKTINNISLSLIGLTVKTYVAVGVLWSKADAMYHVIKGDAKNATASTTFLNATAK